MSLPPSISNRLIIPAITTPLFLVSGPDLIIAACQSGVTGSLPAMNARTSEDFSAWMAVLRQVLWECHGMQLALTIDQMWIKRNLVI